LLGQWKPTPMPISAVYPHNRHLSSTVRVFVDWVAELFSASELFKGMDANARFLHARTQKPGTAENNVMLPGNTEQPAA
jgi:LysR family transcriptional regulator, regulator for bpeEF and oprC